MDEAREAIEEGIRRIGLTALAERLGESTQTVWNWRSRGNVPANKCSAFQAETGVDRRRLRPNDWKDYWPELIGAYVASTPIRET